MFPFLLRKTWTLGRRSRPRRAARGLRSSRRCQHNPSITWIGHATFLVRMDGVTFLTDPIFSERASPVSFAGPQRLVAAGRAARRAAAARLRHSSRTTTTTTPTCRSITALARARRPVLRRRSGSARWCARPAATPPSSIGGSSARVGRVRITCVPAQHFSGRSLTDGNSAPLGGLGRRGPDAALLPRRRHRLLRRLRARSARASARSTSRRCRSAPTTRPRSCSSCT